MTPSKLNVFFTFFPYGGNGGVSSEHPSIRAWFARAKTAAKEDERVGAVWSEDFSDTPITMTRNNAVLRARLLGADVLVMCDSDQHPDLYWQVHGDARPFWNSSFDFLYKRKIKGEVTVVGAPYCGPPPNECVYVFKWTNKESEHASADIELNMYPREEAATMSGIQPCAALPTGLIMFDMAVFEATDPAIEYRALRKEGKDRRTAEALTKPWFYYEWPDIYQSHKASTEDVTCTRDMALLCQERLGYNPLYCNWDAWAGHYKPKCVGKPMLIKADQVNDKYRTAVLENKRTEDRAVFVDTLSDIRRKGYSLAHVNGDEAGTLKPSE